MWIPGADPMASLVVGPMLGPVAGFKAGPYKHPSATVLILYSILPANIVYASHLPCLF